MTTRPPPHPGRALLAILVALVLVLTAACSDAPTEDEIAKADDGVNPSIVSIFVNDAMEPTVEQLGTAFLRDRKGITFQYTGNTSDVLAERVRQGFDPSLWIDHPAALGEFVDDPGVQGEPEPVGDDPMQFVVRKEYAGETPTLEVFGPGRQVAKSGLCVETLPCGAVAREILDQAGVVADPDAEAKSATDLMTALSRGNFDTALVYRSDAARLVTTINVLPLPNPEIGQVVYESLRFSRIPIADEFQQWIQTSPEAHAILEKVGFAAPGGPTP